MTEKHQPDGNGGCVTCREYVWHTDDEMLVVPWPCPAYRLAEACQTESRLDVERLADALKLELNRTHRAGEYQELADAVAAAYEAAASEEGEP